MGGEGYTNTYMALIGIGWEHWEQTYNYLWNQLLTRKRDWEQTGNRLGTDWEQTGNRLGTDWEQTGAYGGLAVEISLPKRKEA
jgi:hypothetical protein